jgi:hypothetical protein
MRWRITVRNDGTELRGYLEAETGEVLEAFAAAMEPFGIVLASPADDDYNPFTDWRE